MKNFAVISEEKFFTAIIFAVQDKVLFVQHWKEKIFKFPGGTYNPKGQAKSPREEAEYYDCFNRESVLEKIEQTILSMLGEHNRTIPFESIRDISELLVRKYFNEPMAIKGIIEYIEETGIIPIIMEPFYWQIQGIQQFFYVCTQAVAFNAREQKIIDVIKKEHLPQRNIDFQVKDPEIQKYKLIDFYNIDLENNLLAHSNKVIIKKYREIYPHK